MNITESYFQIGEILKLLNLYIRECVIWENTELEDEYIDDKELFEILSQPGGGYTILVQSTEDFEGKNGSDHIWQYMPHYELVPFLVDHALEHASDKVIENVFQRLRFCGIETVFLKTKCS